MSEEQINELKIELVKLKTEVEAHCSSSTDFRKDIKESLKIIQSDVKRVTEGVLDRKENCFKQASDYTNRAVAWAIALPGAVLILMKLAEVLHP